MPQSDIKDLVWPRGGIVENSPESSPPDDDGGSPTTQDALNVRCFDSFDRRNRGGQRTGLAKFISTQVNGTNDLQLISGIVEAVAVSADAGFGDRYANPNTLPTSATKINGIAFHPDGDVVAVCADTGSTSYRIASYAFTVAGGFGAQIQEKSVTGITSAELRSRTFAFNTAATYLLVNGGGTTATNIKIFPFSKVTGAGTAVSFPTYASIANALGWRGVAWHPDGDIVFVVFNAVTTTRVAIRAYSWDGSTLTLLHSATHASRTDTVLSVGVNPAGTGVAILCGLRLHSWSFDRITGFANGTDISAVGQYMFPVAPSFTPDGSVVAVRGETAAGLGTVEVRTFSAVTGFGTATVVAPNLSSMYGMSFNPAGTYIAVSTETSPRVKIYPWTGAFGFALANPAPLPTGPGETVAWHPSGQVIAIGHGTTPFMSFYKFEGATVNPSARRQRVIAVAGGNVYRSSSDLTTIPLSNSGAGALVATGAVRGVEAFQKFFFCDSTAAGYKYLDYADNTVKTWTPTAGALPVGTISAITGCRIMALYRGRVVMSGLLEEPHNWFMSKSGDPFDWDYSPAATSPVQAVAGNSSNVGELGDVVTGLFPFNDDIMVMGGVNSIWLMQGDPAAGGAIDNISRQIGIVGPDAGTWDTGGNFFFLGQNGLYRLAQGSTEPILISKGKLDKTLSEINTSTHRVWLTYDALWQGLHIFIIPQSEPGTAPLQYFWDERNDSFWPDQYPAAHGPTCVHMFTADDPDKRGLLMGGFDGYIRQFMDTAKGDDGTLITSKVTLPIINPGRVFASSRIEDIWMQTDASSDPVTMSIYSGDTVEQARANQAAGTVRVRRSLVGGRNTPLRQRIAQNTLLVQLTQTGNAAAAASWAFEQGGLKVAIVNKMHGRRV